jgi:hypothetical protein
MTAWLVLGWFWLVLLAAGSLPNQITSRHAAGWLLAG